MQKIPSKYFTLQFAGKLFLLLLLFAGSVKIFKDVYNLSFGKYIILPNEIYMIDSFKMQGKAFYDNGGKYQSPKYEFSSTNGYSFTIEKSIFKGIIGSKFHDTIRYHGLEFIAYSDKQTLEDYIRSKQPIHINVLQFKIGYKNYIDIDKANREARNILLRHICVALFFCFYLTIFYMRKGRLSQKDNILIFLLLLLCVFFCFAIV